MRLPQNVLIEGIRPVKGADGRRTGKWAVVGSVPNGGHDLGRTTILVSEHESKREAIESSGTNRIVERVVAS